MAGRAALPAGMGRTKAGCGCAPPAPRLHRQVPWMDWMGMGMTTREIASDGKMPDRRGDYDDYESIAAARCLPSTLALGRSVLASRLLLDQCTPT